MKLFFTDVEVFFQVHLFVAQVTSAVKCMSETSCGDMKDGEKQSDKEWMIFTYLQTKKSLLQDSWYFIRTNFFFFFFLRKKRDLLLSQTITSAKLFFKMARHFPQCIGKFCLPQYFSMVNNRKDKGSQLRAIFGSWKLIVITSHIKPNWWDMCFVYYFCPFSFSFHVFI